MQVVHWFLKALPAAVLVAVITLLPGAAVASEGNSFVEVFDNEGTLRISLTLDAAGNPVIVSQRDSTSDLLIIHCNDSNCSGGDESYAMYPSTVNGSSIAMDTSGRPVVAFDNSGMLSILHCSDPYCGSPGDSLTFPDPSASTNRGISLQLDPAGNPVVAYADSNSTDLKVLHCNDPNCAGAGDTITSHNTGGAFGPYATALALDASGKPIVAYNDAGGLRVMHCNDTNCGGGGESVTTPDPASEGQVSGDISLVLAGGDLPVISYTTYVPLVGMLHVLRCNDTNCSGTNESISTPDEGYFISSLALDGDDNPVVSYRGPGERVNVLHCNDIYCVGSDESISSLDPNSGGQEDMAIVLDGAGRPIVAYEGLRGSLWVLHCGDTNCRKPAHLPAVLLVHGWHGDCRSDGTFEHLRSWLATAMKIPTDRVECFDPLKNGRGYPFAEGTENSAKNLKTYVSDFIQRMSPVSEGKIHIVAHSFGGMVSRYYIEEEGGNAFVQSLTLLGTPQQGTALADTLESLCDIFPGLVLPEICEGLSSLNPNQATHEMQVSQYGPGGVFYDLNQAFVCCPVSYHAVAGIRYILGLSWLGTPNDCVVPQVSAQGPIPPNRFTTQPVSHPGTCGDPSLTNDPPGSSCGLESDHVFCDILSNMGYGPAGATAGEGAGVGGQVAIGARFTDHVDDGGANVHAVDVDASAADATFSLLWLGDIDGVQLDVQRPNASFVQPTDSGTTYFTPAEVAPGFVVESYTVEAPSAGPWNVHVTEDGGPATGQNYLVLASFNSTVTMQIDAGAASFGTGQPVTITATLSEGGAPVTGATVDGEMTKPDDSTTPVSLVDDGTGGDAQASDGIYTTVYSDTANCGGYGLLVDASGTATSGAFTRQGFVLLDVHETNDADCDTVLDVSDNCQYVENLPQGDYDGDGFGDECDFNADEDGCIDIDEEGDDPTLGGLRDPLNPWDFYDVLGGFSGPPDQIIDLPNDILGVILHFSPLGYTPGTLALVGSGIYDDFDRGPKLTGQPWNMTAPDGVIDLPNDILGVILQHNHRCT